jgi:hypothetical protein
MKAARQIVFNEIDFALFDLSRAMGCLQAVELP